MTLSRGSVAYGKDNIEFTFFYVDRKTLEIAVHPDQTVVIKAPLGINIEEIQKRVVRRASWIMRQRAFFQQFEPRTPARQYLGGETHLYLGKQYRLRIRKGNKESVRLVNGFFEIQTPEPKSSIRVKGLLEKWYLKKARDKFVDSLNRCWPYVEKFAVEKPGLQIKAMKKRWGSLSAKGRLTLNTDLIKAPRECIDYVIVHELCHLRYPHHGTGFYKYLNQIIPDWEKRKHRLETTMS